MTPWIELASTIAPDGARLSLWRRGEELAIRAGSIVLMSSRSHETEELLATHGCRGLDANARILIGGLGMGFTLREALKTLDREAHVVVAEACADVVDWVRGPVGAGELLDDPRVTVEVAPVEDIIGARGALFDAILLDVDNGPAPLARATNARLYDERGARSIARALRPSGRVIIWSRGEDASFAQRLSRAGLDVEAIHVRSNHGRGERHVLFSGIKSARAADPDRRTPAASSVRSPDPRSRKRDLR